MLTHSSLQVCNHVLAHIWTAVQSENRLADRQQWARKNIQLVKCFFWCSSLLFLPSVLSPSFSSFFFPSFYSLLIHFGTACHIQDRMSVSMGRICLEADGAGEFLKESEIDSLEGLIQCVQEHEVQYTTTHSLQSQEEWGPQAPEGSVSFYATHFTCFPSHA